MISIDQINEVCRQIVEYFQPEKVLLFGSYASGNPGVDSDVDLLVILPFHGRSFIKSLEILCKVDPGFPLDLIARKPGDTERRYQEGDPLIREAIDNGKVLYERNS